MLIGILSDIHGNHIALKSVLKDAKKNKVSHFFILGDFVGYYYHVREVLELIRPWSINAVLGNHEVLLQEALKNPERMKAITEKFGHGIEKTALNLNQKQLEWLLKLPMKKSVVIDKISFLLCHGSPWKNDEYIYPNSPSKILIRCTSYDYDFILMGHTHYPFILPGFKTTLMNPGSVGQPREKAGFASWAIINTNTKVVRFVNSYYKPSRIIQEVRKIDPQLPYLYQVLTR